jgi:hypothetical protein
MSALPAKTALLLDAHQLLLPPELITSGLIELNVNMYIFLLTVKLDPY